MGWFGLNNQEEFFWNRFDSGHKVEIILSVALRESYKSQVIARDATSLIIMTPRTGNTVLEVPLKTEVLVKVYVDGGVFEFKSRVISQDWDSGFTLTLEKPKKIEHVQMRQFYRLNALLPIEYAIMPGQDISVYDTEKIVTNLSGISKDISEGGLQMVIDRVIAANTNVKVRVNLSSISPNTWIEAVAKVLSQESVQLNTKFVTRIQFLSIAEADKDIIRKLAVSNVKKV